MSISEVFISHATTDKNFVLELDKQLKALNINTWIDCYKLIAGNQLDSEIQQAIQAAQYFIVVLSPQTINSVWVKKEIEYAEEVAKNNADYKIIPMMLDGIEPAALNMWFKQEPLGIKIQLKVGELQQKIPDILAALGRRLPTPSQGEKIIQNKPLAELLLKLSRPVMEKQDNGLEQWQSEAQLIYTPSDPAIRPIESGLFYFTAPINQVDLDELSWYLERYCTWPSKLSKQHAELIENDLIKWGKELYQQIFNENICQTAIQAWQADEKNYSRCFSIQIDSHLINGNKDKAAQKAANQVATKLMSLPWELLHNNQQFLINNGRYPIHIRRRLPNYAKHEGYLLDLPIRVLVISPRPEDAGYIDHRVSSKPLIEAVEMLGSLVEVNLLQPPTYTALANALRKAAENEKPYHVVHFDGHGVYDSQHGLGALCFEDHQDRHKISGRKMELIYADKLAILLKAYRVPLVFLEACQTAQSDFDPNASVAASLLKEGVASVIAMSHSVLVKTASLFVAEFYQQLALGKSVGAAMLAGQSKLQQDSFRLMIAGAGKFNLIDWFVPILYQEETDPQLFKQIPSELAQKYIQIAHKNALGDLPAEPEHTFIGRSYELLQAERLLQQNPYVLIKGQGGIGKTTLAAELCRWLVQTRCYQAAAFISLEEYSEPHGIIDSLGKQLVKKDFSVATYKDDNQALLEIQRVLELKSILILADNMESLIDEQGLQAILGFFKDLLKSDNKTRLILTSRESLPAPFNQNALVLGELSKDEAKQLIFKVAAQQGRILEETEDGYNHSIIDDLIEQLGGHARALTLLAKELAQSDNMNATRENLAKIIQELDQKYPNQRERSLFASLELSLKRLSPQSREWIKGLAVFHRGGHFHVIKETLKLNQEETDLFWNGLIQSGLAELKDHSYLLFDPALTLSLNLSLTAEEQADFLKRWFKGTAVMFDYLYQQHFEDSILSAQLIVLDIANLMVFIEQLPQQVDMNSAENIVNKAGRLEQLLLFFNQQQALNKLIKIRKQAVLQLGEWNQAIFENKRITIISLEQQGDPITALIEAENLLKQSQQAGTEAYQEADYDLAMATFLVGRLLMLNSKTQTALDHLKQAEELFQFLEQKGEKMVSVCLSDQGGCLIDLGLYDLAIKTYQKAIELDKKQNSKRGIAVNESQLARIYCLQKKPKKALTIYQKILDFFKTLNEPLSIATIYLHIAVVYKDLNQFEAAENAYLESLKINSQQQNLNGEARLLGNLALLYQAWKKPVQAINYYQQAINCSIHLKDKAGEGQKRSNLAYLFLSLKEFKKARIEILQAIECKKDFGFIVDPWISYQVLFEIEQAENNQSAAKEARQKAIDVFLSYRQTGGENREWNGHLALAILSAISKQNTIEISKARSALSNIEVKKPDKQAFFSALRAIIDGNRDLELANNPILHYQQVVELKILLATL